MKPDADKIINTINAEYEEVMKSKQQEDIKIIKNADILICIEVDDNYDQYSLADHIGDIVDDIPAVKEATIFIK